MFGILSILSACTILFLGMSRHFSIVTLLESLHAVKQGFGYLLDYWNYPDWLSSLIVIYIAGWPRYIIFLTVSARSLWIQHSWYEAEKETFAVAILYLWMKCLEIAGFFL